MSELSQGLHESPSDLGPEALDRHRAIASITEELEAAGWYDQRVQASSDPELARILAHNRDEEKEHAAMVLEWLRRRDPTLDAHLKTYLFTEGSIVEIEERQEADDLAAEVGASAVSDGSLGLGSLKGQGAAR